MAGSLNEKSPEETAVRPSWLATIQADATHLADTMLGQRKGKLHLEHRTASQCALTDCRRNVHKCSPEIFVASGLLERVVGLCRYNSFLLRK